MLNFLNINKEATDNDQIEVFKGFEEVKNIYLDTLNLSSNDVIYAFLNPTPVQNKLYKWLTEEYVQQRVKKQIKATVFLFGKKNDPRMKKYIIESDLNNREIFFIDDFDQPF